jgi:sterol desaturase/sphingolipid hydroxylase (fatty acid hydroxylase superfamily)
MKRRVSRDQLNTIISGILCLVLILLVLQLWLLTATMNAYLGGDQAVVWPAALVSVICFLLNLGLFWQLHRLEQ